MAFTRKNVAAAVAGTLSLAMLTGCPATAPTGTTPSAAPSGTASEAPSAAPTTGTSAAPSAAPSGGASDAPSAAPSVAVSAPPASGKTLIVSGTVRNEKGATVDAATVTVTSLDASVPYTATVQTTDGSYVVNNVPEGANVEVIVTKDGFTSRRRVQSFQQSATGQKNILNFGVQTGAADTDGAAYFISDYPEIASTTPEHDDKGVDPTKLSFKVVLSEAIDEDSRDAFEKNFHIFPANTEAGGSTAADIEGQEVAGAITATSTASLAYFLREGNTFLGSSTNKVKASWNAAGTEVTYTFDGNLQTDDNEAAEYQAALFAVTSDKIEDAKGNMLGTNAAGNFAMPTTNELIYNSFKDPDLAGDDWAETHKSAITFELKTDETDPKLTGVEVVEDDQDLRIELTFSEPMAAYAGSGQANISETVFDLSNYSFMLGEKSGDLNNEDLEGNGVTESLPYSFTTADAKAEFSFAATGPDFATNGDLDANAVASVAIEVEPDAPSQVNIWIRNGANLFDGFRSIKARVEGVTDPAGNNITATDADNNLVSATI
ncbi:MAG: carboxypeptidase regulatory-like domain-containing protein [Candidatus Sericytochromatia bacterium]|nr:carboxypeptidase regulatory-like domain-containing protein [Candidatus Sericytochromatia bacterium]